MRLNHAACNHSCILATKGCCKEPLFAHSIHPCIWDLQFQSLVRGRPAYHLHCGSTATTTHLSADLNHWQLIYHHTSHSIHKLTCLHSPYCLTNPHLLLETPSKKHNILHKHQPPNFVRIYFSLPMKRVWKNRTAMRKRVENILVFTVLHTA